MQSFSPELEKHNLEYREKVRSYYDKMNPLILQDVGETYQSGLLKNYSNTNPYRATNLYCATTAGIKSGDRVLDAGCGVCGPSIDIAKNIPRIKIDAITLSSAQANTARELVQQAGLAEQINIHIGDYHQLVFEDEVFDIVLFLESAGYSYDQKLLFAEVYRVLRPGGILYIKEPFCKESPLSEQEQQALVEFDQIYVYKTASMSKTVAAIAKAGFQEIVSRDLREFLSTEEFEKAIINYKYGFPILSNFGKYHYRKFKAWPIFFGEVKASKPK